MATIVCATRGGEGSRAVQLEAIKRAKETGQSLVFLYVTDLAGLGRVDETLAPAVREELNWLGKALLRIAQQRAGAAHLQAQLVIREGNLQEEIGRFLQESKATLLLLGAPRGASSTIFGDDAVERFARAIQEKTGVPVEVVRP
jgi:nucleotide-binding universal stress UspA family protein